MGLNVVVEKPCTPDQQLALRRFVCCDGSPEWAMDVQRYVRDPNVRKTPKGVFRTLLVVEGHPSDDAIGFCEYGVAFDGDDDVPGFYSISYIGTALKMRGTHIGDMLLSAVIMNLAADAEQTGRNPFVIVQIDRRNKPSIELFSRFGFVNEGKDEEDPEYDLWSLSFEPRQRSVPQLSTLTNF